MGQSTEIDGGIEADRWDDVFRGLSAAPRRRLIVALMETQPGIPVSLPDAVTTTRRSIGAEKLGISLRHQHLPLLAEMGFVEWESDPLVAVQGPRFREVAAVVEAIDASPIDSPA